VCPVCIATMTLIVAGTTSTGGLTTLVVKKLRAKSSAKKIPHNPKQRSMRYDNEQDRASASGVTL
jgi:hypothetical protein